MVWLGKGVVAIVERLFRFASCSLVLSGAIIGGAGDWERAGGGGVQAFDWSETQADMGKVVTATKTKQYGDPMLCKVLRPME
jgi:hypothetical protein